VSIVIVTGSSGLVGSEAARFFVEQGATVVGIDNDMRQRFFGAEASTLRNRQRLEALGADRYRHVDEDIRSREAIVGLFREYGSAIEAVIHTAAQPSHDWAANDPHLDFQVNANGTLNLLEATRQFAPDAPFIFTSTNKVYGDTPNRLPLVERETRWEIDPDHPYADGIREDMSIDQTLHSLFGASKVAADVLVQEYGRYFGMPTAAFRCGCITGPGHAGAELHGFLAYLMKCTATGRPYTVFGYKGKQVRDNIHASDLTRAIYAYYMNPRPGAVYNMGGGRFSNCSMLEAIDLCESITGRKLDWHYDEQARRGDHIWWISSLARFEQDYPDWRLEYDVPAILEDIYESNRGNWQAQND
jgi:CDP-paratose 2-epimerase